MLLKVKMKRLFFIILIFNAAVLLSSCIEVKFRETQPTGISSLTSFPSELRGTYQNQDGDTLEIGITNVNLLNRKSKCDRLFEQDSLSNTVQLTKWKKYFFVNLTEDSLWTVCVMKKLNNGDLIVSLIDAESESTISLISEITPLETIYFDEEPELYIINPEHKDLEAIIESGAFSIQYIFKKIKNWHLQTSKVRFYNFAFLTIVNKLLTK